jgi:hypothetical protein
MRIVITSVLLVAALFFPKQTFAGPDDPFPCIRDGITKIRICYVYKIYYPTEGPFREGYVGSKPGQDSADNRAGEVLCNKLNIKVVRAIDNKVICDKLPGNS